MTTVFPEVRLKTFLEMRGADAGRPDMMLAQSALWVGLLYDAAAQQAALALTRSHALADFAAAHTDVPCRGLAAKFAAGTLRDLARDALAIARGGLKARGHAEQKFLDPLDDIVAGGPTQAEHWLARFRGPWQADVTRIFDEAAI